MADPLDAEYFALLDQRFDEAAVESAELMSILRLGLDAFDQLEAYLHRNPGRTSRQLRSRARAFADIRDGRAALYAAVDHSGRATST